MHASSVGRCKKPKSESRRRLRHCSTTSRYVDAGVDILPRYDHVAFSRDCLVGTRLGRSSRSTFHISAFLTLSLGLRFMSLAICGAGDRRVESSMSRSRISSPANVDGRGATPFGVRLIHRFRLCFALQEFGLPRARGTALRRVNIRGRGGPGGDCQSCHSALYRR